MAEDNIEVKLDPIAYLKLLMYFLRFSNQITNKEESRIAYGLLLGYKNEENQTVVSDFFPIKNSGINFLDFEDFPKMFDYLEKYNEKYDDDQYPEYIVGWARNSKKLGIKTSILDKKNHLYFQSLGFPRSIVIIFNCDNLAFDDGFTILQFEGDFKEINIMSNFTIVKWEYSDFFELDDVIDILMKILTSFKSRSILIKDTED
jgi:hypothetical protein